MHFHNLNYFACWAPCQKNVKKSLISKMGIRLSFHLWSSVSCCTPNLMCISSGFLSSMALKWSNFAHGQTVKCSSLVYSSSGIEDSGSVRARSCCNDIQGRFHWYAKYCKTFDGSFRWQLKCPSLVLKIWQSFKIVRAALQIEILWFFKKFNGNSRLKKSY